MIPIRGLRAPVWQPTEEVIEPEPEPQIAEEVIVSRACPGIGSLETISLVAARFELRPDEVTSPRRHRKYLLARSVAIRLLRDRKWSTGHHRYSTTQIGRFFGRDHSTVCHSLDTFDKRMEYHPEAHAIYLALREVGE